MNERPHGEVVYALLHRQELFEPFAAHPRFAELVENIKSVLAYFNAAMDAAGVDAAQWTTERVAAVITAGGRLTPRRSPPRRLVASSAALTTPASRLESI